MDYISRLRHSTSRPSFGFSSSALSGKSKANAGGSAASTPLTSLQANWKALEATLRQPDQAALHHGVGRTDLAARIASLGEDLVAQGDAGEGENAEGLEWALTENVFAKLVKLTASDSPKGVLSHVVRLFSSLCVELPAPFLAAPRVHGPLARLLRICTGDAERAAAAAAAVALDIDDASLDDSSDDEDDDEGELVAVKVGSEEERALVELLCQIASRLRNTPELLPVFFREAREGVSRAGQEEEEDTTPHRSPSPAGSTTSTATLRAGCSPEATPAAVPATPPPRSLTPPHAKSAYDFALLTHLLRFAHREASTGELARAGLFFLFTRAFAPTQNLRRRRFPRSPRSGGAGFGGSDAKTSAALAQTEDEAETALGRALAQHILQSDFADVIGAGLGAVYGLLPNTLAVKPPSRAAPSMLGGGMQLGAGATPDEEEASQQQLGELVDSSSTDVQAQLRLLVDLIEFTQHLMRTASTAAASSPLDPDLATTAATLQERLANSVRKSFLQNILNPSLLECSDADGSAVAVMSYLDLVLGAVDDEGPLAEVIVGWLVGDDAADSSAAAQPARSDAPIVLETAAEKAAKKQARRRSVALHEIEKEHGPQQASDLFTGEGRYDLRDLIVENIGVGKSSATKTAAFRLAATLLAKHGRFTMSSFLDVLYREGATAFPFPYVEELPEPEPEEFVYVAGGAEASSVNKPPAAAPPQGITITQHMQELDMFLSLVASIEQHGVEGLKSGSAAQRTMWSTGYEHYLRDAEDALMRESTYLDGLRMLEVGETPSQTRRPSMRRSGSARSLSRAGSARRRRGMPQSASAASLASAGASFVAFPHKLAPPDKVLRALLGALARYFENTPESNVALTGVLATLALCPWRSLEGWLVFENTASATSTASNGDGTRSGGRSTLKAPTSVDMMRKSSASSAPTVTSNGEEYDSDDSSNAGEAVDPHLAQLGSFWGQQSARSAVDAQQLASADRDAPVVLGILRSLVSQIAKYRSEIPGFDRFLEERRRGLTFVENLNDALGLDSIGDELEQHDEKAPRTPGISAPNLAPASKDVWEKLGVQLEEEEKMGTIALPLPPSAIDEPAMVVRPTALSVAAAATAAQEEETPAPKREGFARWFGGRNKSRTTSENAASPGADGAASTTAPSSTTAAAPIMPFAQHYTHTASVRVEARAARTPRGPWADEVEAALKPPAPAIVSPPPAPKKRTRFARRISGSLSDEEDASHQGGGGGKADDGTADYFLPGADDDEDAAKAAKSAASDSATNKATLSALLDNVVILEEAIKELVAIIQVRRALGIDALRFAS